jgi:pimeloyl-[acyl-carrier protein] methyl ester esterase
MKLILVSGWATRSTVWETVVEILADRLAIESVDWWEAIDGELDSRIAENPERCIVAGWSMGGQIALRAAELNPGKIAGLFLASSMCCLVERGGRPGVSRRTPHKIKEMLKRNRKAYLRAFFTQCLDPIEDPRIIGNLLKESDSITMDSLMSGLEYMTDTEAGLSFRIPLMLVHGRDDNVIPPECSEYISSNTGDHSRVAYIEKAGHLLPIVKPEIVGDLLNEFSEYCIAR